MSPEEPAGSPQPAQSPGTEGLSPRGAESSACPRPSTETSARSRLSTTQLRAPGSSTQPSRAVGHPWQGRSCFPAPQHPPACSCPGTLSPCAGDGAALPAQSPPQSLGWERCHHPWHAQSPQGWAAGSRDSSEHRWNLGCHRLAPSSSATHTKAASVSLPDHLRKNCSHPSGPGVRRKL